MQTNNCLENLTVKSKKTWVAPTISTAQVNDAQANQVGQPYDGTYGYTSNGVLIQLLHS